MSIEQQDADAIRSTAQDALVSASEDGYRAIENASFRVADDGTFVADVYTPGGAVAATYEVEVFVGKRVAV